MAGLLKSQLQIGDSLTATNNFSISSAAADGNLTIARGNFGVTTQDILKVTSTGNIIISGNILTSTGAALNAATGGGTNKVFYENDTTVTASYTITSGKNAVTAGPITVSDGVSVSVPDGSSWSVV